MTRKAVRITKREFEQFLSDEFDTTWFDITDKLSSENNIEVREHVYATGTDHDDLQLLVWSTIDVTTGISRPKDSDAIRNNVWSQSQRRLVGGREKTLRIGTWKKNLSEKIDYMYGSIEEYAPTCNECGSYMMLRDGKYGEFFGCFNYPDCTYTMNNHPLLD